MANITYEVIALPTSACQAASTSGGATVASKTGAAHWRQRSMYSPEKLVANYLAIWNESNEIARKSLIRETWTNDLTYVDPTSRVVGQEQLDELIGGFQSEFPNVTFRQVRETESHHNLIRFSWELVKDCGEIFAAGTDVAVIEEGRIMMVGGFYDQEPILDAS